MADQPIHKQFSTSVLGSDWPAGNVVRQCARTLTDSDMPELTLDHATTALVLIDLQRGIVRVPDVMAAREADLHEYSVRRIFLRSAESARYRSCSLRWIMSRRPAKCFC